MELDVNGIRLYLKNGVLSPNIALLSYGYQSGDEIVVELIHVEV